MAMTGGVVRAIPRTGVDVHELDAGVMLADLVVARRLGPVLPEAGVPEHQRRDGVRPRRARARELAASAVIDIQVGGEMLRSIAEVTLALLLFSDAARVNVGVLRQDRRVPMRLLMLGLPLTLGLGVALAVWLFPDLNPWAAAAIAAARRSDRCRARCPGRRGHARAAPHPSDPQRRERTERRHRDAVRHVLRGRAVADTASQSSVTLGGAIADLAIGVLTGIAIGLGGGILLRYVRRLGWSSDSYRGIGVLALALAAYSASIQSGATGSSGPSSGGLHSEAPCPP